MALVCILLLRHIKTSSTNFYKALSVERPFLSPNCSVRILKVIGIVLVMYCIASYFAGFSVRPK